MEERGLELVDLRKNQSGFEINKILEAKNSDSLVRWAEIYFQVQVVGSPPTTVGAKKLDLSKFLTFFLKAVGHERIDGWTPSVTKQFITELLKGVLSSNGKPFKATSVNRIMATLKHFASWVHAQRPFLAGHPFEGVKNVSIEEPVWNGLSNREIMRLKAACEQREKMCERKNQNPLLESAVFFVLLHTGMRESELVSLNSYQYHHRGFHDVKRKGSRISGKIPCPSEARDKLDSYLALESRKDDSPLFLSRYGNRLKALDVNRICARIARQANAHLPDGEQIKLTPHMLRHSFLKRVADQHGIHVAQQMSGNISMREVFRYTKPSASEMEECAEGVFS